MLETPSLKALSLYPFCVGLVVQVFHHYTYSMHSRLLTVAYFQPHKKKQYNVLSIYLCYFLIYSHDFVSLICHRLVR